MQAKRSEHDGIDDSARDGDGTGHLLWPLRPRDSDGVLGPRRPDTGGDTREAGWLLSAQAVGGLVGALVVGTWGRVRPPISLLGWGAIGIELTDLLLFTYPAFAPGIWLGLGFMAAGGVPGAAFDAGYAAAIQVEAEDAYRGRVFGALLATSALLMIVGAAIAGLAMERFGPVAVPTIDRLGYVAGGVFALRALATATTTRHRGTELSPP